MSKPRCVLCGGEFYAESYRNESGSGRAGMMSKAKEVFKYIRDNDSSCGIGGESDGCIFEGLFELPDDGCPASDRFLRLRVVTHEDGPSEVVLDLVMPEIDKERRVGSFRTNDDKVLEDLLYPVATCVTKTYLTVK